MVVESNTQKVGEVEAGVVGAWPLCDDDDDDMQNVLLATMDAARAIMCVGRYMAVRLGIDSTELRMRLQGDDGGSG